jgi:hypothetical protein
MMRANLLMNLEHSVHKCAFTSRAEVPSSQKWPIEIGLMAVRQEVVQTNLGRCSLHFRVGNEHPDP